MDLQRLMQQAQKMQNQLGKIEKELEACEYEGSTGSDSVKVLINGKNEVKKVEIKEELLEKDNKEVLEDMILVAFNNAIKASSDDRNNKMKSVTGGVNIPGMF